jgi:hypothetical protein
MLKSVPAGVVLLELLHLGVELLVLLAEFADLLLLPLDLLLAALHLPLVQLRPKVLLRINKMEEKQTKQSINQSNK